MKKHKKTILTYLGISLFTILFEFIYSRFSHGMSSDAITFLFVYPLVLGSGIYGLMDLVFSKVIKSKYFRLFSNIYNTAIATLMSGLMLKGIFEIAGSSSGLLEIYFIVSYILLGISLITLFLIIFCKESKLINNC